MDNFLEQIRKDFKDFFIGEAPLPTDKYCVTGVPTRINKTIITKNITFILSQNRDKHFKLGKTGNVPLRIDKKDYRTAPYTKIFLLYKSRNKSFVESLERYYTIIYKPQKLNDNIDNNSLGTIISYDDFYILYMVI